MYSEHIYIFNNNYYYNIIIIIIILNEYSVMLRISYVCTLVKLFIQIWLTWDFKIFYKK